MEFDNLNNKTALHGIRIIEMTEALAGPYCAMMLGDLGADVIKVERPGNGDQARGWGPPFLEGESAYFLSVNRNKRSIELNIKNSDDLAVFHNLLETADVFVTNIPRMSSLKRAKIDPKTLQKINPRLIYAGISGYGHTGPKSNRGGYDIIAQGEAGLMTLTGEIDGGPMRFPTPMADITAGIYTTIGILGALYARDNSNNGTGKGQFLDVSLVDAQTTWLANIGGSYFATGNRPERLGNIHPTVTPYQPMRARDKMIIVGVGTERLWERLCDALGLDKEIQNDPRFSTNAARNLNRDDLIPILEEKLLLKDASEWVEIFVKKSIPSGPINFPDDTLTDEHIISRGMVVELEHPLIGIVKSIGNPINLSDHGPTYRRYPPTLGEHNEEIRNELRSKNDSNK
ncbi:MAG: formyl-CoA transferase [Rhodospirillaceae bacterium]|nr:formyl-CoA transferase [Rhodospirillaceae bacterium]|tara:strand:+ start:2028 stop:3230 length:1203 start_codon:yes stop_codon:yes gene_type:complete